MGSPPDYRHRWRDGGPVELPCGKVVCVGRNYAAHAAELNNPVPSEPLLFIKPSTALASLTPGFVVPTDRGACHFETEIALLIGKPLRRADEAEALAAIAGVTLAIDLTLRDMQERLKRAGHPWEKAKAFDGACPVGPFLRPETLPPLNDLHFSLHCDGVLRQQGRSADMITPIPALLAGISRHFTLLPGDLVLTGTPAGVGPLNAESRLRLRLEPALEIEAQVSH